MSRGLLDAGIDVVLGIDFNPRCRQTYEINNGVPFLAENIINITAERLIINYPVLADVDDLLLIGCAPCQPFSSQRKVQYEHESRNLLDEFGRLVEEVLPAHILIENVPGIRQSGAEILQRFLELLDNQGYEYCIETINAKYYGVPQNRRRFVLIASRLFQPHIPEPTHGHNLLPLNTVHDAIHHFPHLLAGEVNTDIPNHEASELSEINMERILHTPHNGGDRRDWPEDLFLNCHMGAYQGHTDVYGRMAWNSVAPTLTSKCYSLSNGRYGHPEQNRAISLREAAALQTFPDDYVFHGCKTEVGRQVGNAVPVLMANVLGAYILEQHELH